MGLVGGYKHFAPVEQRKASKASTLPHARYVSARTPNPQGRYDLMRNNLFAALLCSIGAKCL